MRPGNVRLEERRPRGRSPRTPFPAHRWDGRLKSSFRMPDDPLGIHRRNGGSLQAQLLHSFPQVLVIDLEDNPRAIIRSRKDIGSGVLTIYRLAFTSVKTHIPDHFYQRVLRVQRRCFERVDVRGHQSSRPKEFFATRKNFQEVLFLHALNTFWSTKHEDVSITSGNLLHVEHRVCRLIDSKE